jgi:Arc/MetJ family transcription regulator
MPRPNARVSRPQASDTRLDCVSGVYRWCMARTNIDIDDELVAEVMRRYGVATKKQAVDLAMRRLVGVPLSREFLLGLEGVGWDGDLEGMRSERPGEF